MKIIKFNSLSANYLTPAFADIANLKSFHSTAVTQRAALLAILC
jgi:hypothetical protein